MPHTELPVKYRTSMVKKYIKTYTAKIVNTVSIINPGFIIAGSIFNVKRTSL